MVHVSLRAVSSRKFRYADLENGLYAARSRMGAFGGRRILERGISQSGTERLDSGSRKEICKEGCTQEAARGERTVQLSVSTGPEQKGSGRQQTGDPEESRRRSGKEK